VSTYLLYLPQQSDISRCLYVVQANTFWGLSDSPYVIQRMVTVARGATLSIAPGVNVVFDGADSGLTVAGIEMSSGR